MNMRLRPMVVNLKLFARILERGESKFPEQAVDLPLHPEGSMRSTYIKMRSGSVHDHHTASERNSKSPVRGGAIRIPCGLAHFHCIMHGSDVKDDRITNANLYFVGNKRIP